MEILNRLEGSKGRKAECQKKEEAIRKELEQDDDAVRESRQKIEEARAQV